MKILGIKFTHDAAVALIVDGKLAFSVELEKRNNGDRYTKMKDMDDVHNILAEFGYDIFDMDSVAVDGWGYSPLVVGDAIIPVAPYGNLDELELLRREEFETYVSYRHVAGHVLSAYATAPFTGPAYCITWDGGQPPRVHYVDPENELFEPVSFVGNLFEFFGTIYTVMGYYFGPYKQQAVIDCAGPSWLDVSTAFRSARGIPGKLMSYIGQGTPDENLIVWMERVFRDIDMSAYRDRDSKDGWDLENRFVKEVKNFIDNVHPHFSDADVLASLSLFLERLLVKTATSMIPRGANLCFSGGSALNIKWNTALRESGHFADVWVPPFPNDSGSAIGVACCEMAVREKRWKLDWNVYSGPYALRGGIVPGWSVVECDEVRLALLLADNPTEPVVVLNGRAELGPRALGNRSILCSAEIGSNKALLNDIKNREHFRPVAPICMEEFAPDIFNPGSSDPYMLFDHFVRDEYVHIIPAVVHLDKTARLQTVNPEQNKFIHELLRHYWLLTGIPLLCNTSANFNGKGFFPDVESAMKWGGAKFIYSNGYLYERA